MMTYLYTFCNVSTKAHTYFNFTSLTQGFGLEASHLIRYSPDGPVEFRTFHFLFIVSHYFLAFTMAKVCKIDRDGKLSGYYNIIPPIRPVWKKTRMFINS